MIIGLATCFIAGMTIFVYCYTSKRLLKDTKLVPTSNYKIGICLLGGVLGELLFLLSYYFYQDSFLYCIKLLLAYELLLAAALIDYKLKIIPNFLVLLLLICAMGFFLLEVFLIQIPIMVLVKEYGLGALFGGGIFLLAKLFMRNGVGMGDIKLFGSLGLLLGWVTGFNLIFFSILISAIYGIVLLLRKKADKKLMLPLAPFAAAGMTIIILLGV